MYITEEKILQWSTQESTDLSSNAYNCIRDCIEKTTFYSEHSADINLYLQGSYANATNIRRDSDVDIVCQYNGIFRYDDTKLSDYQKTKRREAFQRATLTFEDYKNTIYSQLRSALVGLSRFDRIEYGAKSLKLSLKNPSINVDVVPCFQYRNYHTFSEKDPYVRNNHHEGIVFDNTTTRDMIINYPKLHKDNGIEKNKDYNSHGQFKPCVRAVKKIRNLLEENRHLRDGEIPSYFIENLLYNVPDNQFDKLSLLRTFNNAVDFLSKTTILGDFICQHKQWKLFGIRSTQWNIDDAQKFISLLAQAKDGKLI